MKIKSFNDNKTVRCLIYYRDGEIKTASRGGKQYDKAMEHFLENDKLKSIFKKHPKLILDGEIYVPGWSLQKISGLARQEKKKDECKLLQYYLYDIVDPTLIFKKRLEIIDNLEIDYALTSDLNYEFSDEELKIKIVPHIEISGWLNMKREHNRYVGEGYEGLVIRNGNKVYGVNKRTNDMVKIKEYREDTFEVVGIEQGLRPYADMTFICVTEYGHRFNAKPMGDLLLKTIYTNNFEKDYLGKKGDVKYFYYSNQDDKTTGVPLQPTFKAFRYDLD